MGWLIAALIYTAIVIAVILLLWPIGWLASIASAYCRTHRFFTGRLP